jgi:hypothetical protein
LGISAYLLYVVAVGGDPPVKSASSAALRPIEREDSDSTETAATLDQSGVPVDVPAGDRPSLNVLDDRGRLKYQFHGKSWKPLGPTRYEIERPKVRIHLDDGRIADIESDNGVIKVDPGAAGAASAPKSGQLTGHVHIAIDRKKEPNREEHAHRPQDVIHIWMDDLTFDLETFTVQTSSRFKLQMAEADVVATGFYLKWDELAGQLRMVRFDQGERIIAKGGSHLARWRLPGLDPESDDAARAENVPVESASARKPVPPVPQASDRRKVGRRRSYYHARFAKAVKAVQFEGDKPIRELQSRTLELAFYLTKSQEESSLQGDSSSETVEDQETPKTERLELTWSGAMEIRPVKNLGQLVPRSARRAKEADALAKPVPPSKGVVVIARDDVYARVEESTVECNLLVYNQVDELTLFAGAEESPVLLRSGRSRSGKSPEIKWDMRDRTIHLEGPGTMTQTADLQSTTEAALGLIFSKNPTAAVDTSEIRWSDEAYLTFKTLSDSTPQVGQVDDSKAEKTRNYLSSASFRGDAFVNDQSGSLSADRINMTFNPPEQDQAGWLADLDRAKADGKVTLVTGDERMTAHSLDIETAKDARGESSPKIAHAEGEVEIRRGRELIRAKRLTAWFHKTEANQETRDARSFVQRVVAEEDVLVYDPLAGLRIQGDRLDAEFAEGSRIEQATVSVNRDDVRAFVLTPTYWIEGREISLDQAKERVQVPGAGRLRFLTQEGLDGRVLPAESIVDVKWAGGLDLQGARNDAVFTEEVHVHTERLQESKQEIFVLKSQSGVRDFILTCSDHLRIEFADKKDDMIAENIEAGSFEAQERVATPLLGHWLKPRRSEPEESQKTLIRNIQKQPRRLEAEGDVFVQSASLSREGGFPYSRMTILGPRLTVDMERQVTAVEGRGAMLVEDYRPPNQRSQKKRAPGDPLLVRTSLSAPNQTRFRWASGLTYDMADSTARFREAVRMEHRAGAKNLILKRKTEGLDPQMREILTNSPGKGRVAALACEDLMVQFARTAKNSLVAADPIDDVEVRRLVAKEKVYLQDGQNAEREVACNRLEYSQTNDIVTIFGDASKPAWISITNKKNNEIVMHRGTKVVWDLSQGKIESDDPHVLMNPLSLESK